MNTHTARGAKTPRDVIIVGGGPAGLAAGTYLARAGWDALLIERGPLGGQARRLGRIENYPGFPAGIAGARLMRRFAAQAARWKLAVLRDEVRRVRRGAGGFTVEAGRRALRCRAAILCPGTAFRSLGLPGEARLRGRGVYHAAFDQAPRFKGRAVAVAGGGDAAAHQALSLARHAGKVTLVVRGARLKAIPLLQRRLRRRPGIETLFHTAVARLEGRSALRGIILRDVRTGAERRLPARALFVLIGARPQAPLWAGPGLPEGLYLAGDAAAGAFRQVAIASGDGLRAAMACEKRLLGASRV